MGYYEDHLHAVAKRRRANTSNEARERKTLKAYGWNDTEVETIIALEKKYNKEA